MCSIEDNGETQPVKRDNNPSLLRKPCVKCGNPGVLVTRTHDSFCRSCFQVYVIHKFRAAIGKSKLIREGEHVLVAFSGGANSSALLHLIQDGLSERAHRKLRFKPTFLHVDECGVLDIDIDNRQELRQKVLQLMLHFGFPSYIADLEKAVTMERLRTAEHGDTHDVHVYCESLCQRVDNEGSSTVLPPTSHSEQLKRLISSVASVTSQEDFIRRLRNQLIVSVARRLGFTKVLTGECSTRLSIQVLSAVAQGRGSQIPLDTAFCDQRNCDVLFVRPVRDLSSKELVMYNSLFGVDRVFIPSLTTKMPSDSSIEKLTEKFVMGLQADFPSTVANIVRTSEKLECPEFESSKNCACCQSSLDTNVGKASALYAVEFSQKISRMAQKQAGPGSGAGDSLGEQPVDGLAPSYSTVDDGTDLYQALCYGCRLSLQNFNYNTSALPAFITKEATQSRQREELREQISEFLLEDDDR